MMLRQIFGVLLIVAVLLPLPFAVVGYLGVRDLLGQVNDTISTEIGPLKQDFADVRAQLSPVWQDLEKIPSDLHAAVVSLLTTPFNNLLSSFSVQMPQLSGTIDVPTISSGSCDQNASLRISYPAKIDLGKTKQIDATGNTDFSNFLQGTLGVTVKVTVPDLANAVTWQCILVTLTPTSFNLGQLPTIPGLDQAKRLFGYVQTFIEKSLNGIIDRLAAVGKPLESLQTWLNDVETFRGKLENLQQTWGDKISAYLTLAGICGAFVYLVIAALGVAQGIRMIVGSSTTKP